MDEIEVANRYWCHMCSRTISPVMEPEIKCPHCENGFVEEMNGGGEAGTASDVMPDRALSLWAPVLGGMIGSGGSTRRRRIRREQEEDLELPLDHVQERQRDRETELRTIARRLRRNSAAILQLLQAIREENRNGPTGIEGERDRERERERERERMILINPFNQTVIFQGSLDSSQSLNQSTGESSDLISLGDYFLGPGLEQLLQHLSENDPNRYGTPPAQKEAVDALPTVKVKENISCSICLEDFEIEAEAREIPCKHKFHTECILPWLELHSSCPVCRFQMPADESKVPNNTRNSNRVESAVQESVSEGTEVNERRFSMPASWPLSGLFSFLGSQSNGDSSTSGNSTNNSDSTEN